MIESSMKVFEKDFFIFFILIALLAVLFFYPSLFTFFVQDDFWLLRISRISEVGDFVSFFVPLLNVVWYRPLSSQVFFFLGQGLFGLHPFPFHVVTLATHFLATYFLYRLTLHITKHKQISVVASLIYEIHQIHTVSLSWLAAYSFVLGPLVLILVFYAYVQKQSRKALFFYALGLLTHEIFILLPLGLVFWKLLSRNSDKKWFELAPYISLSIVVTLLRWVFFPTKQMVVTYNLVFSPEIFSTFKFYLFRLAGIPLGVDFMSKGLKVITIVVLVEYWVMMSISFLFLKKKLSTLSTFLPLCCASFVFLIPFLLLSEHVAPYYISFVLVGVAPVLGGVVWEGKKKYGKSGLAFTLCLFLLLQFIGSQWIFKTHWIFKRANLAKYLIEKNEFVHSIGSEEYFVLGAGEAEKVYASQ